MMSKIVKKSKSDEPLFDLAVNIIGFIILLILLYPVIFVLSASISDPAKVMVGDVILLPKGLTMEPYKMVFQNKEILVGFKNSVLYTVFGTVLNVFLTILAAYPLSRRDLPGRNLFIFIITFTMFFGGGMIPKYLLIKDLHMLNTFSAMIVPTAIATMNLIIMRTYFQSSIPVELQEAAFIDGCGNFRLLLSIILPLSKPIIAIMILYYGVDHWNNFFDALLYLRDKNRYPLQLILRNILLQSQMQDMGSGTFGLREQMMLGESMKYSVMVIASLPMIMIYPFVQKYFVKGVMVGALKG
jgi:putative aldouronate transport system permease protein